MIYKGFYYSINREDTIEVLIFNMQCFKMKQKDKRKGWKTGKMEYWNIMTKRFFSIIPNFSKK